MIAKMKAAQRTNLTEYCTLSLASTVSDEKRNATQVYQFSQSFICPLHVSDNECLRARAARGRSDPSVRRRRRARGPYAVLPSSSAAPRDLVGTVALVTHTSRRHHGTVLLRLGKTSRMELPRARGQSHETASAGLRFRTEATHKVYTGRACWCLCKAYTGVFAVGEHVGAADVEAPCAQPDPQVLGFISAAEFTQGLKRANEMMDTFKSRSQPLWVKLVTVVPLILMVWTILASSVDNFAGISEYPNWATAVGWVAVVGSCFMGASINQKQEKIFRGDVETELKKLWESAVAQGVGVAFENERSGSGDDNTVYPAAVTITLPHGPRGA